jgi:citrate synthase
LTTAAGGCVAAAVASAISAASAAVEPLAAIETALAATQADGAIRAADALDADAIDAASWKEPYRTYDPRTAAILGMLADASSEHAAVAQRLQTELEHRGAPPPTAGFALAAVAWACGMPPGSAAAISLISRTVGWIAHAIEESQRPTPYRPRLAYTGRPPRTPAPRRTLDAVQDYLSRR